MDRVPCNQQWSITPWWRSSWMMTWPSIWFHRSRSQRAREMDLWFLLVLVRKMFWDTFEMKWLVIGLGDFWPATIWTSSKSFDKAISNRNNKDRTICAICWISWPTMAKIVWRFSVKFDPLESDDRNQWNTPSSLKWSSKHRRVSRSRVAFLTR